MGLFKTEEPGSFVALLLAPKLADVFRVLYFAITQMVLENVSITETM